MTINCEDLLSVKKVFTKKQEPGITLSVHHSRLCSQKTPKWLCSCTLVQPAVNIQSTVFTDAAGFCRERIQLD